VPSGGAPAPSPRRADRDDARASRRRGAAPTRARRRTATRARLLAALPVLPSLASRTRWPPARGRARLFHRRYGRRSGGYTFRVDVRGV